ncbi:MAG: M1 family metallopeptidase [Fimbriimonas sp.]
MIALTLIALTLTGAPPAQQQNPFLPPRASLHYSPDRTCDLQHLEVDLDVDYPNKTIVGTSTNTLSPLRSGITEVLLHAGSDLTISRVTLDGKNVRFRRDGNDLLITTGLLKKGTPVKIAISYTGKDAKGRPFGAGGGWHWIQPTPANQSPTRVGFWTQGETNYNSQWAPTWDYPNDFTTSETRTTVPAEWDVVGNGVLVSTKTSADKKKKTYTWRMTQPHATYLLSLVGGPFDIKKDKWEGVDLWYVVPRGEGIYIDDSFGHTKDMLSFFSNRVGVKYPWPKYAQNAMYDFGGGMENVSATTLGEGSLTEARAGYFNMDSLNSHELGHQWFGDLVSCYNWGDTWLNESFATYMDAMYFQHSRGEVSYQYEIDGNMRGYFGEASRYKRPLSTKMYPNGDAMFDSHSYPKGGAILHTLRQYLGDEAFFEGLKQYLTKWRHTPVESAQLRRAMTEASGINVEPFWAQWIEKPGHPVLDYTWSFTAGDGLALTVKQLQDTSDGTPIYDIPATVDFISSGGIRVSQPVHLTKAEETFKWQLTTKPAAVVFDPEHRFLRQIPNLHWTEAELPVIARFASNAPDRAEALRRLLEKSTEASIALAVELFSKDMGRDPVFQNVTPLGNLAKPELRSFWTAQLESENFARRAAAVQALGKLPQEATTTARLRSLVNDKAPIQVVVNAINALAAWDAKANADLFTAAVNIKDRRGQIKRAAEAALAKAK